MRRNKLSAVLFILAAVQVCTLTSCISTQPQDTILDMEKALNVLIPWSEGEQLEGYYAMFKHECCDCGLNHWVILHAGEAGIQTYWWRDEKSTTRSREYKGWGNQMKEFVMKEAPIQYPDDRK
jgi:hypothetical protein